MLNVWTQISKLGCIKFAYYLLKSLHLEYENKRQLWYVSKDFVNPPRNTKSFTNGNWGYLQAGFKLLFKLCF